MSGKGNVMSNEPPETDIIDGVVESVEHRERWLPIYRRRYPLSEGGVSAPHWEPGLYARLYASREEAMGEIEVTMTKEYAEGLRPDKVALIRVVVPE